MSFFSSVISAELDVLVRLYMASFTCGTVRPRLSCRIQSYIARLACSTLPNTAWFTRSVQ